jgi:purine-nucleoside phosphorylase
MEQMLEQIKEAAQYIQGQYAERPQVGVVLGSGLGPFSEQIEKPTVISYQDIPHFPVSTVEGHAGKLFLGKLHKKNLAVMSGRFHYYEGYNFQQVVFPIRVMARLGIHTLIVTNAAGGINKSFTPGDLMIMEDHINLTGSNPLIGPNLSELGLRFPDMSTAYTPELRELAEKAAKARKIPVQKGVYIGITGPSFETPAEIRMMRVLGADAVGMSTVAEVIAARHVGLKILGISCITNMAAGMLNQPLTHEETKETAAKAQHKFIKLLQGIIAAL